MQDDSTRRSTACTTSPIPTDHARPLLLRVGKGQQCGQTVPGHRVGQDGHQTLPVSTTPAPADGAGGSLMK